MELKVRNKTLIESITFNSCKLLPLVAKVQYVKQINLKHDIKMIISDSVISPDCLNIISSIGFEK